MRVKEVPKHIKPKWSDVEQGWGMYNSRLQEWIGKRHIWEKEDMYAPEHPVFKTEVEAVDWYKRERI